jgi:hypothetical protein
MNVYFPLVSDDELFWRNHRLNAPIPALPAEDRLSEVVSSGKEVLSEWPLTVTATIYHRVALVAIIGNFMCHRIALRRLRTQILLVGRMSAEGFSMSPIYRPSNLQRVDDDFNAAVAAASRALPPHYNPLHDPLPPPVPVNVNPILPILPQQNDARLPPLPPYQPPCFNENEHPLA